MTNLAQIEPKKETNSFNFKESLHIVNVFLLYLRKVNTYTLPAFLALVFWFEMNVSVNIYALITLVVPGIMTFNKIKSNKINETVGLFVRYRELKKYTNHIILDVVCLYYGLHILRNILMYILIEWNWYIVMALPIADLLDLYVILQLVFTVTDAYRAAKENKVETNPIFNFIKNNEFGDWLGVCYRFVIFVPMMFAVNRALDNSSELLSVSTNIEIALGFTIFYTVCKYWKHIREKIFEVYEYANNNIKFKDIIVGIIAAVVVGFALTFGISFALVYGLSLFSDDLAKTIMQNVITANLFCIAICSTAAFVGIYAMINSTDAINIAKKFMEDEKKEKVVEETKEQ